MTALDLPAIRALLERVTPGEWAVMDVWDPGEGVDFIDVFSENDGLEMVCRLPNPAEYASREPLQADAAFIAAAPSIVAQLLGVVEAGLAACETVIDNTDGHKPPGPPHPSREQATAMRIRAAITGEGA